MDIHIDDEFASLIPPLTDDEFSQLEENILEEGCRDPLVMWQGVLLDGHNRYKICSKHNIDFDIIEIELEDREAAKDWIDKNQLGRRNLTADQRRIIIGRRYNREKKQGKRTDLTSCQSGTKLATAEKIAKETGTSDRSVKRYAKDAELYEEVQEQ